MDELKPFKIGDKEATIQEFTDHCNDLREGMNFFALAAGLEFLVIIALLAVISIREATRKN